MFVRYLKFNEFDKNLGFTVDIFQNEVPHFLDLELSPDRITISKKQIPVYTLKARREISKKRCFDKYCSCVEA